MITIDASTKCTGMATFINGSYKQGVLVDVSDVGDLDERFPAMVKQILDVLNEQKPKIIYMEEIYGANNVHTSRYLFRLIGVVYGWCLSHKCEFNTVFPSAWRKALGFNQGKGVKRSDLKKQSINYVNKRYNITVNDDMADAICMGDYAVKLFE